MIGNHSNSDSKIKNGEITHSHQSYEEKFRIFLQIIQKRKNSAAEIRLEYTDYNESLKELEALINEFDKIEKKEKNIDLSHTHLKFLYNFIKDNTFFSILENLNIFTIEEAKLIYSIFKILKTCSKDAKDTKIHYFLHSNLDLIIANLLKNLNADSKDFVIIIVSKCIRKLSQESKFLENILTWENFNFIYSKSKNKKFILLQECFSIISYFVESPKVDKDFVSKFLELRVKEFSSVSNSMLNCTDQIKKKDRECIEDDFYLLKRETLILIEKILMNSIYEKFTLLYTNRIENLKAIMMQLNNKCLKIVYQAIDILYYFFVDVETKSRNIKLVLHTNKKNFYEFFDKHENFFIDNSEMSYKKSFILYELERLENYLEES